MTKLLVVTILCWMGWGSIAPSQAERFENQICVSKEFSQLNGGFVVVVQAKNGEDAHIQIPTSTTEIIILNDKKETVFEYLVTPGFIPPIKLPPGVYQLIAKDKNEVVSVYFYVW